MAASTSASSAKTTVASGIPSFTIEGGEYCVPENLLRVDVEKRDRRIPVLEGTTRPEYLNTIYDEFSRNFVTVSIAAAHPSFFPGVPYNPENTSALKFPDVDDNIKAGGESLPTESKSRILHHYDPGFVGSPSTFRSTPPETRHYLGRQPQSDFNVLFKITKIKTPDAFEPLFASVSLFSITADTVTRLSEAFHFDLTPTELRMKFKDAYKTEDVDVGDGKDAKNGLKVDPATILKMCCFNLPSDLKRNDVYAVVQVTKVLTGDPDKVLTPYIKATNDPKGDDNVKRLYLYRQMVGAGAFKIHEDGKIGGAEIKCSFFATKSGFSDQTLGQFVRDIESASKSKLDLLNFEVTFKVGEVGSDLQTPGAIPEGFITQGEIELSPIEVFSHSNSASNEALDRNWEGDNLIPEVAESHGIRRANFLTPLPGPDSAWSQRRQIKYSVDHTTFLYPLSIDNIKTDHRNLSVKVQLVEFESYVGPRPSLADSHVVLRNVYNNKRGPLFCSAAFSSVSYHSKAPTFLDEFKVRLPDVVTDRHFFKFTILHIHVKPKSSGGRPAWGGLFGHQETTNTEVFTPVGCGFLSLLETSNNLIPDREHVIPLISMKGDGSDETPAATSATRMNRSETITRNVMGTFAGSFGVNNFSLRLASRSLSSFVSTCPRVQRVLLAQPKRLGYLTSSICNGLLPENPPNFVDVTQMTLAISDLQNATGQELTNHFLILNRILIRAMCGGGGNFDPNFSNPYRHSNLRCQSFLMMLQLFGRLAPEVTTSRSSSEDEKTPDEELLISYIEYVFDEEIPMAIKPLPIDKLPQATKRIAGEVTRIRSIASIDLSNPDPVGLVDVSASKPDNGKKEDSNKAVLDRLRADSTAFDSESQSRSRFDSYGGSFYDKLAEGVDAKNDIQLTDFINPTFLEIDGNEKLSHIDYLASHFASQVERIILEDEIQKLITVVSKDISDSIFKATHPATAADKKKKIPVFNLGKKNYRWWKRPQESLAPFDPEAAGRKNEKLDTTQELRELAGSYELYILPPLKIRSPRRYFDSLKGYDSRKGGGENASNGHWWPWMYEVVAHQWVCLLDMFQGNGQTPVPNGDEGGYPLTPQITPTSTPDSKALKDSRLLAIEHGPALLRIIMKSLIMRIQRENKAAPVVLDPQIIFILDRLFSLIAKEAGERQTGLFRARRLTASIAQCLRSLFAIVVPSQVCRLASSYFTVLSYAYRKVEETEVRLLMLQELSTFDHLVAANFPSPLDMPLNVRKLQDSAKLKVLLPITELPTICSDGFRAKLKQNMSIDPPPHWLAELLIYESFNAYRQVERKVQEKSLKLLRDILVRQSYDVRYQSDEARKRAAMLYLPILREIVKEAGKLALRPHDSFERRELLPLLLCVLQDVPAYIIREEVRQFCYQTYQPFDNMVESRPPSMSISGIGDNPRMSYKLTTPVRSSLRLTGGETPIGSPLPIPSVGIPGLDTNNQYAVILLMVLLNLILDTFEYRSFEPSIKIADKSGSKNFRAFNKNSGSDMTSRLDKLELIVQNRGARKGSSAPLRNSTGAGPTTPSGEERKWRQRATKLVSHISTHESQRNIGVDIKIYNASLVHISFESTKIVINTLRLIIEESPIQIQMSAESKQNPDYFVKTMEYCLFTALHGLYNYQTQHAIQQLFDIPMFIISKYGIKLFIAAVGDTLQDWMRIVIRTLSYGETISSTAATDMLICLLHSYQTLYGSITILGDQLKAVFSDALDSVLMSIQDKVESLSDEDRFLQPLHDSLLTLKKCFEKDISIGKLFDDLIVLFRASSFVRNYISNPVPMDWNGGNTLDGVLDKDISIRTRRKELQAVVSGKFIGKTQIDYDHVMMTLYQASDVFDAIRLPRFKIRWLEQLARLHEDLNTRGDGAEIRWRIYEICSQVEHTWLNQWTPRQPIEWEKGTTTKDKTTSVPASPSPMTPVTPKTNVRDSRYAGTPQNQNASNSNAGRNFLTVLFNVLNQPQKRPWSNQNQYDLHVELTLSKAKASFSAIGLSFLAERCTFGLIDLYRRTGQVAKIGEEYISLGTSFKAIAESGDMNSSFGMGTFYWVQCVGAGAPLSLQKEFVYRNSNNLHISEFHAVIRALVETMVPPGTETRISPQPMPSQKDFESKDAVIFITSVKPIFSKSTTSFRHASQQAKEFQHSAPFTKDGKSHAKNMDEQWKRTIVYKVPEYFPFVCSRQLVTEKKVFELSPIEVAIDDIQDRIVTFRQEMSGQIVLNNIMRIIQGSVMPQVNAGAAEVARVFLVKVENNDLTPKGANEKQVAFQKLLKETLLEFLHLAGTLLLKCREVMKLDSTLSGDDDVAVPVNSRASNLIQRVVSPTASDAQNSIWQAEMEKGFDILVDAIMPYISDLAGIDKLKKKG